KAASRVRGNDVTGAGFTAADDISRARECDGDAPTNVGPRRCAARVGPNVVALHDIASGPVEDGDTGEALSAHDDVPRGRVDDAEQVRPTGVRADQVSLHPIRAGSAEHRDAARATGSRAGDHVPSTYGGPAHGIA